MFTVERWSKSTFSIIPYYIDTVRRNVLPFVGLKFRWVEECVSTDNKWEGNNLFSFL